ncbi:MULTISPECIES: response regulator [Olivibacter]|uniref:Response regulator n=2 Tax=Olivibacter TaxID=376469 RepID=A0ABV6HK98_9SPHI|nr:MULTISPECIES: response regulator [unclassified Olivibacter]MDM8175322.1 response regulator [Olivibacter sp. 47]QEL02085.1 response regulator [Olivibacter sp. LS-1]
MKNVLIIEDNDDIRESTVEILELAGYRVFSATEGRSGVELALKNKPDIILCDIMMPNLDGYGVLFLLGKHQETASIPFIFLTAKAERADMRKAMEMGADDYLTKPFDDVELLNAIETRLRKKEITDKRKPLHIASEEDQNHLLNDLHLKGRAKNYKKKQSIYEEGDKPLYIYKVKSGKVRSYLFYHDGRELSTNIFTTGDYFGYEALLAHEKYSDNTQTIEETELCLINKDVFFELLYQNPAIAQKFIGLLSENIREKEEQLLRLAYHTVRKRVADALVVVSKKFLGDQNADECVIRISRDDLAALAGTANETISRTLADFKEEKLLSKEGNAIRIHSISKLSTIKQ